MATMSKAQMQEIADAADTKYGVPVGTTFKRAGIESSFTGDAVSPKGAKGFLQWMEPTRAAYGVTVGDFASEADGAARYTRDNLKKFGGNMDMANADYNGGPKAVAALAKGSPWPETADYIQKMNGGPATKGQPLPQFSAGNAAPTQYPPSEAALDKKERADKLAHGGLLRSLDDVTTAAGIGMRLDNSVYNWYQNQAMENIDPNFQREDEYTKNLLTGIPQENWSYILQGNSAQEDTARRARTLEALQSEQELAKMGISGTVGRLGGALFDLPTLLMFVPGAQGEGLLNTGSRIINGVRMGMVAGVSNAAYEAATYDNRPLGTPKDIAVAGLMGIGMGFLAGSAHSPYGLGAAALAGENKALSLFAANEARAMQREELKAIGSLTPSGEELLKKLHTDETLSGAGVTRGPYSDKDLTGIGSDPTRSKLNIMGDSTDISATTYAELRDLKNSVPTDTTHIVTARDALTKAFGSDILDGLEGSGRIKFVNSQVDLPASLRDAKGVNAFYDHLTDTTFLMADRLNAENVRGIIMHDVGVHQGLERVVGTPIYKRMIAEIERLASQGDAAATSAVERALKSRTKDYLKGEEKLAYYMEHMGDKSQGVFREAIAQIKAFLIERLGVNIQFNSKDLIALVQGSVRKVAKDKEFGSHNTKFPYVWSGGPVKGIDKFSTSFVGKGEGNINQGWGLYTSSSSHIGNWYREKESALRGLKPEQGGLYQLKVNNVRPEEFLRWHSTSQSREVQAALKAAGIDMEGKTGKALYLSLMEKADGETPLARAKVVSEFLDSIGVRGSTYDTAQSRGKKVKSSNHVFFSDRHLEVSLRFSEGETKFVAGPGINPVDAEAATKAGLSPVYGIGLGVEDVLKHGGVPTQIREIADEWIGTTKGYKDHSVVKPNASSLTTMLTGQLTTGPLKKTTAAFTSWTKETGVKPWETAKAYEDFGEQAGDYVRGVDREFPKQVIAAGEALRDAYAKELSHVNNPGLFYGGKTKGLTETVLKDPITGVEKIVGALEVDRSYLPRSHDNQKTVVVMNEWGRDPVISWWAGAYKSGRAGISDESASKWSNWYIKTLESSANDRAMGITGDMMRGMDKEGIKNSMMLNGGYSEADALMTIEGMFPTKTSDAGLQTSLKHRNTLNELYTETWKNKAGEDVVISINSFTHSNAIENMKGHMRRTAGNVALAEHSGIYKAADIDARIGEATRQAFDSQTMTKIEQEKYIDTLRFVSDHIRGIPQENFTTVNKSLEMMGNFNVIRLMGGAVFNQVSEMSQHIGALGWKSMAEAIPEIKSLSRDLASGKAPHEFLEHLENTIGGSGAEYVERMNFSLTDKWVRNKGDTPWNRRLDALDNGIRKMAAGTLEYTGMVPLMIQQKRLHSIALVNHFINDANSVVKSMDGNVLKVGGSTFLTKDRLAWMGLSAEDYSKVQAGLKKHSTPTKGEFSGTNKMDFNKWIEEDPSSHAKFMEAIHRESRRVIQENDLESMIPIMGTTLGKTVFQFMNFSMHGWNKSLMFALNHKDYATLSTVLHGGLFSGITYMGRTALSAAGMDEESKQKFLEQRMATQQIVANSIGRIAQVSLLPGIYDSTLGNLTGPQFSGMRTTSSVTGLASLPSVDLANSALSLMKMVKNGATDAYQTTEQDVKQWGRLLPLNNVVPISTLLNHLAGSYPKSAKQE